MPSKFLNIDTDGTLSENSDETVSSQKAVKTYVDQKVHNATITIKQGDVVKGTFTTNQNSNQVIELSAPGSVDASYDAETETFTFS